MHVILNLSCERHFLKMDSCLDFCFTLTSSIVHPTYKSGDVNMHETYDIENYQFMLKLLISKLEYCIV